MSEPRRDFYCVGNTLLVEELQGDSFHLWVNRAGRYTCNNETGIDGQPLAPRWSSVNAITIRDLNYAIPSTQQVSVFDNLDDAKAYARQLDKKLADGDQPFKKVERDRSTYLSFSVYSLHPVFSIQVDTDLIAQNKKQPIAEDSKLECYRLPHHAIFDYVEATIPAMTVALSKYPGEEEDEMVSPNRSGFCVLLDDVKNDYQKKFEEAKDEAAGVAAVFSKYRWSIWRNHRKDINELEEALKDPNLKRDDKYRLFQARLQKTPVDELKKDFGTVLRVLVSKFKPGPG